MTSITQQRMPVPELKSKVARNQIVSWIRSGRLAAGQRLPSEREIAKELNITTQTVRRGLVELVTEGIIEKRARVGNFVKQVQSHMRVGIALPSYTLESTPQHPAGGLYIGGAGRVFSGRDYLFCNFPYRPGQIWVDVGDVAVAAGVHGMLIMPEFDTSYEDLKRFIDAGIKIVLIGSSPYASLLGIPCVTTDYVMGLSQIVDGLIKLGHRRIVYVKQALSSTRKIEEEALHEICRRTNLGTIGDSIIYLSNEKDVLDLKGLESIFDREPLPTAVITADEFIASELFRLCAKHGISVPAQMSIASRWDAMPTMHPIALTAPNSIDLAKQEAEIGARLLSKLLSNEEIIECVVSLRCEIVWKNSTGPAVVQN